MFVVVWGGGWLLRRGQLPGHGARARPYFNKRRAAISPKIQRRPDWMIRPRLSIGRSHRGAYQKIIVGTIVGTDLEKIHKYLI